ncbi:MAG: site-specific integrase [Chitinophagaceae bacterium]|nr:site-specific integrase [Chitinophagaceae bacterium]
MTKLLNIHFTFSCRTSHKNKEGQSPMILRVTFRGERREVFTGLYCFNVNWNAKDQRIEKKENGFQLMNQNLQLILRKAIDAFDELKFSGNEFTIGELIDKIRGKEARPTLLIDYLEEGNQRMKKRIGSEILKVTYNKYKRSLEYMKDFLQAEYKVKNFGLQKLNAEFIERYFQYLRAEKEIAHNTACKYLVCVKTVLLPAIRTGVISDPFYGVRINTKPVFKEFLTQDEIDKISNLELNDPDLDRKRDIFLFACYTGLAYVDLQQLDSSHLVRESDDSWYIRKPRQKTGQDSIIPLLPVAIKILKKYSPSKNIIDFDWYVSTNQKMNFGLKYIGKKAGIGKKLHMHLARHTFATTVTLSNGVPIETVSRMLGHASIRQTQHYAKVVPLKIKLDMEKIRDLYK